MIPNPEFFPGTLQGRAGWYLNFNTNIQIVGGTLGLTAGDLSGISKDNDNIQFLAATALAVEAYTDAVRQYRIIFTEGDIGDPTPDFPADITLTLPFTQPTGAFERLIDIIKRIRAAPAYTAETGALLGIIPEASEGFNPESEVVSIDATVDPGNEVKVTFVRGKSDGIRIETAIDKGSFASQGNYMKSPVVLEIPQNEDELPRSVQVRARYLDGNTPVGDWSDVVTVQTIP